MSSIVITYTFSLIILLLLFFLIRFIVSKYFKSQRNKLNSKNYPIIFALSLSFSALVMMTSIWPEILDFVYKSANSFLGSNITQNPNLDTYNFISYMLFLMLVGWVMFLHYKKFSTEQKLFIANEEHVNKASFNISPPPSIPLESPVFYKRIKELFELKFPKVNLDYNEQDRVLFGKYKDGYRDFSLIIYCHESPQKLIVTDEQIEIAQEKISTVEQELNSSSSEQICDRYYIVENGEFKLDNTHKIHYYSENEFVENLIDFTNYLKELIFKFEEDRLPFSLFDRDTGSFTLAKTFIPPLFNDNQPDLKNYLDNWLNKNSLKHIALLGQYGLGKTSFMKYYASEIAKNILSEQRISRYPVFISLTSTSPMHRGIENALKSFIIDNRLDASIDAFYKLIHKGKIVFLLDGFDEMGFIGSHEQRFQQLNAIWQLATKGNKIIISGRPSYFPNEFEEKQALNILTKEEQELPQDYPFCERLELNFFNAEQIEESIKSYYPNPKEYKNFLQFIKGNNSIYELCKRPSMLHIVREMLPTLFKKTKNDVIVSSSTLMQKYTSHWIDRQLNKSIVSAVKNQKLKKSFVFEFFIDLVSKHYNPEQGNLTFTTQQIKDQLKVSSKDLNLASTEEIEGFETEILSGYFLERVNNDFKFVHKSFLEYFLSLKIIHLLDKGEVNSSLILEKDWSDDVINFVYEAEISKHLKSIKSKSPLLLRLTNSPLRSSVITFLFSTFCIIESKLKNNFIINTLILLLIPMLFFLIFNATNLNSEYIYNSVNTYGYKIIFPIVLLYISFLFIQIQTNSHTFLLSGILVLITVSIILNNATLLLSSICILSYWFTYTLIAILASIRFYFILGLLSFVFILSAILPLFNDASPITSYILISLLITFFLMVAFVTIYPTKRSDLKLFKSKKMKFIAKAFHANFIKKSNHNSNDIEIMKMLKTWLNNKSYLINQVELISQYSSAEFQNWIVNRSKMKWLTYDLANCLLIDTDFEGFSTSMYFRSCNFRNVNFEKVKPLFKNFKIEFYDIDKYKIDEKTINSIAHMLDKNGLSIQKNVIAPTWLIEKLRDSAINK